MVYIARGRALRQRELNRTLPLRQFEQSRWQTFD
jgi:hypothetical protein